MMFLSQSYLFGCVVWVRFVGVAFLEQCYFLAILLGTHQEIGCFFFVFFFLF